MRQNQLPVRILEENGKRFITPTYAESVYIDDNTTVIDKFGEITMQIDNKINETVGNINALLAQI